MNKNLIFKDYSTIIFIFILFSQKVFSQSIISNEFKGSVVGLGFGCGGNGLPDTVTKNYPFDCTQCQGEIKGYVIADEFIGSASGSIIDLSPFPLIINDQVIYFSNITRIGVIKNGGATTAHKSLHFSRISLSNADTSVFFKIPPQNSTHAISSFFLVLECENSNFSKVSYILDINTESSSGDFEAIQPIKCNPIDNFKDCGFSIIANTLNFMNGDSQTIKFNDVVLGQIAGADNISSDYYSSGSNGHFQYSNGLLTGLDDDSPDILMVNSDALSNVIILNSYSSTQFTFSSSPTEINNQTNFTQGIIFSYTSNCPSKNYFVSPDTTICPNTQVQLSATGGTSSGSTPAYEWWPQKDLSCYDCPNPIFSGDSSQLYTVRIWGSDSCSVVRPIMIHVRQKPKTTFYNQNSSLCADSTAFVNWQTAGANTYSLDNGAFQPAGFYNQLPAGEHLLTVRDAFGCTYDTLVLIDDYSSVVANLSVSPLSGEAPLVVQITNQSTEFTDYSWSVNNNIQPNASNSFQAFTAGEYTVQLIAWQNDPTCADTAFQTISVSSTGFYIYGSSLVSASSNAQNTFSVLTNGTPIVKVNLYDAQGRLLKTKTNLQLMAGSNTIWSASELSDIASEMVLYRIEWQNGGESGELKGKVLVVR